METTARAKFIRMSPRKVRLVADLVRGMTITDARHQLLFSKKDAAVPVLKVLNTAVANAENNHKLDATDFIITTSRVNEGPTIHRFRPRAHGKAAKIRKRMSHITIAVGPKKVKGKELEEMVEVVKEVKEKKSVKSKEVEKK